jgi:predicted aspartyl protease
MPICDCGFPAFVPIQKPDGNVELQLGNQVLLFKGPTIQVEVGFETSLFADPAQAQNIANSMAVGATQAGVFQTVEALVDTGAFESCIDEELAASLNLPVIDRRKCSGVGGEHELDVYLGHIRIPSLSQIRWGQFVGAKLSVGGQPHKALIGRAHLQGMILIYDGRAGTVTLSV